jgi:hypothetical protein
VGVQSDINTRYFFSSPTQLKVLKSLLLFS